jgi:hypothetical protein
MTRLWVILAALALLPGGACGTSKGTGKKRAPSSGEAEVTGDGGVRKIKRRANRVCTPPPEEPTEPAPADTRPASEVLPAGTVSLKVLLPKLKVYEKPSNQSEMVGEIKRYSRLALGPTVSGRDGCQRFWMRVDPRGWVCGDHLKADQRPVLLRTQPPLEPGAMLPGKYAWVKKGGADLFPNLKAAEAKQPSGQIDGGFIVRWAKTVEVRGTAHWQISKGYLIPSEKLLLHKPSPFQGVDLTEQDVPLPLGIVRAKTSGAVVYDRPGGKEVGRVEHHAPVPILETQKDGKVKYYRIGDGRWVMARRVISAWPAPDVPPGLKPCEKWIEIVIDHQSLVAYEGTEPVYATMISTGDKKYPTKYGIFRLWWKKAITDMTSSMAGSERYRVDDVPWAQFFYLGQALHGAYWHSDWGNRRSHGCINLSPKDAKWLFDWTVPSVPPGWLSRRADESHPGTLIRIKHKVDHQVPFLKYARKVAPREDVKRLDAFREETMKKMTDQMIKQRGAGMTSAPPEQ